MRLGVVLTGAGACAAASAGALTWLLDAGVSPCAVCGMQAAASRQADTRDAQAQAVRDAQLTEVRDLLATILATMEDMLDGGLAVKSRGREIARLVADA